MYNYYDKEDLTMNNEQIEQEMEEYLNNMTLDEKRELVLQSLKRGGDRIMELSATMMGITENITRFTNSGGSIYSDHEVNFHLRMFCEHVFRLGERLNVYSQDSNSESVEELLSLPAAKTVESSISTINKEEEIQVETVIEESVVEIQAEVQAVQKAENVESIPSTINKGKETVIESITEESNVTNNTPITTKGNTIMAIKVNAISDPALKLQVEARNNSTTVNTTVNTTQEQTMQPISQQNSLKTDVLTADSIITKVELIVNITLGENNNLSTGTQGVNASKGYIIGTRSAGIIRGNSKDDSAWAEFHIGANKYDATNGVDPYGRYNNAIWRFTDNKGISKLLSHEEGLRQWANVLQIDVEHIEEASRSVFIKVQMPETASAISNMLYGTHTSLRSFIITFNGINDEDAAMFKYSRDAYRADNNREDATCLTPVNATVAFSSQVYNLETINTLGANPNGNLKNILCDSVKQKKSFLEVIRTNNSKSSARREARKEAGAEANSLFDSAVKTVEVEKEVISTEEVVIPENTTKVTEEVQPQVITEEVTAEVKPFTGSKADFLAKKAAADQEAMEEVLAQADKEEAAKVSDPAIIRAQMVAARKGLQNNASGEVNFGSTGRIVTPEAQRINAERDAEEAILAAMDDN